MTVVRERAALVEFARRAQIDHRAQAESPHDLEVGIGEAVETVGAEQGPPARRTTVDRGVSAHVAEVVHGIEADEALRIVTHGWEWAGRGHGVTVPRQSAENGGGTANSR